MYGHSIDMARFGRESEGERERVGDSSMCSRNPLYSQVRTNSTYTRELCVSGSYFVTCCFFALAQPLFSAYANECSRIYNSLSTVRI